jgi:hypothetical protein
MATVTSFTSAKILEMFGEYASLSQEQRDTSVLVAEMKTQMAENTAAITTLNETDLPNLEANLAGVEVTLLDLNDNRFPALETTVNDLNTNRLPAVETSLADLNDNRLPALEGKFPITGPDIAANAVEANHILARTITANEIASNTITANEILARTITALEIAADTITANEIAVDTITANEIAADTITANEILARTITANEILANTITANEILANTITANEIASHTITGEELFADVILATTRIAAVGSEGQSVELNPAGFYVYGPISEGRPAYVEFPTEGGLAGRPNIISGTLQATTLSVEGNPETGQAATFRQNSQIEPGATFTLNDSIVAPIAKPSAETLVNEVNTGYTGTGALAGAAYHPGEDAIYYVTNNYAYTFQGLSNIVKVFKLSLATNTVTYQREVTFSGTKTNLTASGLVYLNGKFHVGYEENDDIKVARYDPAASWTRDLTVNYGAIPITSSNKEFTIGTDGLDLWVSDFVSTTSGAVRFRRFAGDMSSNAVLETINTTYKPDTSARFYTAMYSLSVGDFDFGSKKFVLTFNSAKSTEANVDINYDMAVFTSAGGGRDTASEFNLMRKTDRPILIWRGTSNSDASGAFVGVTMSGVTPYVSYYSNLKLSGRSVFWWVGSTFYRPDTDGAGPITEAETIMSPQTKMTMNSRWRWKITVTAAPLGLQSKIYVSQTGAGQSTAKLQATLPVGVVSTTGQIYNSSGALSPLNGTFGSSEPAVIRSQATTTIVVSGVSRTSGSTALTGSGKFKKWMVGQAVSGSGIPSGATIMSVATDTNSAVLSANATATVNSSLDFPNQPKMMIRGDGVSRIYSIDELVIGGNDDANTLAGNSPPLRIGNLSAQHLRIDGNELLAMSDDSTQGTFNLNLGGSTNLGDGKLIGVNEIRYTSGPIVLDLQNGKLELVGGSNMRGRLQDPTGGAVVWQSGDIKIVQAGYQATDTTAGNTRQVWCDRVNSYRSNQNLSDMSVKKDIAPIDSPVTKMKALKPSKYKRKDYDPSDSRFERDEYGFIAQEVQQVIPEAVSDMGGGLLGLQYQTIFTVGMAALHELISRVEALEKKK